jgi:hypothetical protein
MNKNDILSSLFMLVLTLQTVAAKETMISWWEGGGIGLIGLIILVLDFIAIFELLKSEGGLIEKLLWVLFIIFFPVIGLMCYW